MLKMYLPEVPSTLGGNVIVSEDAWTALVKYLSTVHDTMNRQADEILKLSKALKVSNDNIKTLAKAVEGVYND